MSATNYAASQLILENSIKVQLAFKNLNTDMYAVVSFTDHNGVAVNDCVAGSDFDKNGNYLVLTVDQVVLADARTLFTIQIYNADGTLFDTHIDSVESIIARNSNAANTDVFQAIMNFADGAFRYFHP